MSNIYNIVSIVNYYRLAISNKTGNCKIKNFATKKRRY